MIGTDIHIWETPKAAPQADTGPESWPGETRERMPKPAGWLHFEKGSLTADQVLHNLETAVSLLQTIEGGLTGLAGAMGETITTLHNTWKSGDRNNPPEAGCALYLESRLRQMDELARACRFHGRGLIDGQSGVVGLGSGVEFVRGGPQTVNSPANGYTVSILSPPSRAAITGGVAVHEDWLRTEQEIFLADGDRFVRHNPAGDADIAEFLRRLQQKVRRAGLDLEVGLTRQRRLLVRHNQYGSHYKFKGLSRNTPLLCKRPGRMEWSRKGQDIQGTLHGEPAFGVGRMLVGLQDNANTSDLAVLWRGGRLEEGREPRVFVVQNAIRFQNSTEAGLAPESICLPSMYMAAQGKWLDTRSGYRALADARADTWQELADALQVLFAVSCEIDEWREQVREWIKSNQDLALEYLRKEMPAEPSPGDTPEDGADLHEMLRAMQQLLSPVEGA